ncbi:MAG TPA: glycogen debranching N-terminal domain-containing protein [Solirubrobacteraceae bacterium]|nr:glycogen debranching N-terminal domain-containing protein [Solirubrobacteraceae bacterium]
MTFEVHATAAGVGHPPAEQAPGTLATLAETIVIKEENVFVVSRRDGSLPVGAPHPLGLYYEDCRFLSGHELHVNGVPPRLLVASAAAGSESVHELTNPALPLPEGRLLPLQSIQLRLERRVAGECELEETLLVHSYDREPLELELDLLLDADFEPMLAIRGIVPAGTRTAVAVERLPRGVRFSVHGRDDRHRATTITADRDCGPGPVDGSLRFVLALAPGGEETITLRYALHEGEQTAPRPQRPRRRLRRARDSPDAWLRQRTQVETDDELFNRMLRRSLLDMRMLHSRLDGDGYYAAGVPWYATLFGRDSLIAATQMLAFDPPMAEQTLRVLAGLIGTRDDAEHDEDPGKVLHELRAGEVARLALTPLARYYGTVDATPLFLCLLCEHADWSGNLSLFRELRGEVDAMLGWIDGPGDRDRDGLLEYKQRAADGRGLRNQGWKDSDEGILDERGVPLEPPVALIEPQAYAVRAKRRLARLFALDGDEDRAVELLTEAAAMGERLERFWLPERGFYSMGFGADGRPSEALASNQGHLLWAWALPQQRAQAVRDALMSDAMFSGWGIRTLAEGEVGYNPVGYHLGTVWPHDTAMIAFGLRKHGFDEDFARIFEALLEAGSNSEGYRLPELFAGFSRTDFDSPVPYPVACQPQAWAAGSIPYLTTSGLGLVPDALGRRLRVRRPSLPRWLNRVEVRGLRVADARVDLLFERAGAGEQVVLTDARIEGDVEVVLEISATRAPTSGRGSSG